MLFALRSTQLIKSGAIFGLIFGQALVSSPGYADGFHNVEGVWFSGYKRGRGEEIGIEFTGVQDTGKLRLRFRRWEPIGSTACEYVFNDLTATKIKPILNGSYGTAENCPTGFTMTFERTGPDTSSLFFADAAFLDKADMAASLRPLRTEDRRAQIANLDILGIATGMAQLDAETILTEMGFAAIADRTLSFGPRDKSWEKQTKEYGRQALEDGQSGDVISIQYSAHFTGDDAMSKVMEVRRGWTIPKDRNIAETTIKSAFAEKYGPAINRSDARSWDRAGNNLTSNDERRQMCQNGTLQTIDHNFGRHKKTIGLYCGPVADMGIANDRNSGRAANMSISILDPDEVWDDFWNRWSRAEYQKLAQLFESVSNTNDAAPEL